VARTIITERPCDLSKVKTIHIFQGPCVIVVFDGLSVFMTEELETEHRVKVDTNF